MSNIHIAHVMVLNSLDEKYSKSVIFWLYEKDQVLKTDLQSIVKNLYSLNSLLLKLEKDGIITTERKPFGKNITEIRLTKKGRFVAEQLKKAQEIANSPTMEIKEMDDLDLTMTDEEAEMAKHLNLLFHINVMDDHITVEEVKPGKPIS